MEDQTALLMWFFGVSVLISTLLYGIARAGRDMRRFGDRQRVNHDLYRFIVTILTAIALYLLGRDPWVHGMLFQALPWPDGVLLFAVTALPTLLLCWLAGRWYVGYAGMVIVQAFLLAQLERQTPGLLHGEWASLWGQHALFDAAGVVLYAVSASWQKKDVPTRHMGDEEEKSICTGS